MTHTGKADVVLVVVVMFGNGYKKRQVEETYRFYLKTCYYQLLSPPPLEHGEELVHLLFVLFRGDG